MSFLSVSEDEPTISAFKLLQEYNAEFIGVMGKANQEIIGLLFSTDIVYILRKPNYLNVSGSLM